MPSSQDRRGYFVAFAGAEERHRGIVAKQTAVGLGLRISRQNDRAGEGSTAIAVAQPDLAVQRHPVAWDFFGLDDVSLVDSFPEERKRVTLVRQSPFVG
jgi:hypothetical protein